MYWSILKEVNLLRHIIDKSDNLVIRSTQENDLEFVTNAEREEDNAQYVGQWTKEQHLKALTQKDIMHLIVEEASSCKAVGYVIIAGLQNPNNSIELMRIVITDKGKGFGRQTLQLIKKIAFEKLKAHRLWLDVRLKNYRAQSLYQAEGFTKEGVLRECILYNGNYESLIVMSILEMEYYKHIS
jgi:RimJ/RimL family protein N-acetyltransferase